MKNGKLARMSVDELWMMHKELGAILSMKLDAEKKQLERRLASLQGHDKSITTARRPYPKVYPKYCNPDRPSETWSGRGKKPRWVTLQLGAGKKVDDLLIARVH